MPSVDLLRQQDPSYLEELVPAAVPAVAVEAGARLVILNRGETPLDGAAQLRFEEAIGEVFPPAVRKLEEGTGERYSNVPRTSALPGISTTRTYSKALRRNMPRERD